YNPLGTVGTASDTGSVTPIGGYNPIPSVGTATGTGNITVIGGQNPLDLTSAPLNGSWFVPTVGYIPIDLPMVVQPEISYGPYGITPYAANGDLFGGL